MTKAEKIAQFDPNSWADKNANIFGLPFTVEESVIVILPVPWEVTVSYGGGTVNGPEAIFDASFQVDLYDPFVKDAWKAGIAMDELSEEMKSKSELFRQKAEAHIADLEDGGEGHPNSLVEIENACRNMIDEVKSRSLAFLEAKKSLCLLGGDHSTPLGLIQALGEVYPEFGILQIDAHADLRDAYEGFEQSHASIMFNVLKNCPNMQRLCQVGIRDIAQSEIDLIHNSGGRIKTFFDWDIKEDLYRGKNWAYIVERIINHLPEQVYISFDIDGLRPYLCPNTGTPVTGGFELEYIYYLFFELVKAGKKIIGFDLNEVSPGAEGDWDANVGARALWNLVCAAELSRRKIKN